MEQYSRRDVMRFGTASAVSACAPRGALFAASALSRHAALQFGCKALLPLGLYVAAKPSHAEPFTIIATLIFGLVVGSATERSKNLADKKAWMARQTSLTDDFHDANGARFVVKPEYRGVETLPNGVTIDTTRDGRLALAGPGNKNGSARKDLSEDEAAALLKSLGIVLPKTERRPSVVAGSSRASQLQREAWQEMFGGDAVPNKMSYMREFSDLPGNNSYIVARHKGDPNGESLFYVARAA